MASVTADSRPVAPPPIRRSHTRAPITLEAQKAKPLQGYQYAAMMAGYPIAWVLGLAPAIFPAIAAFMIIALMRSRPLKVHPGTLTFALFIVVVAASIVGVNTPARLALWIMRASWYLAAFIAYVYLAQPTGWRARRATIRALIFLWLVTVSLGAAALMFPTLTLPSVAQQFLPGFVRSSEFIRDLTEPRLAEVQIFWNGVQLNRPAGPYSYTNAWGSAVAMLTPFAIAGLQDRRIGVPRWLIWFGFAVGSVPFLLALNRGAWLSLIIGLSYGFFWVWLRSGRIITILSVATVVVIGIVAAVALGVVEAAAEQLSVRADDSNATRLIILSESISETLRSPFIGHGTPLPSKINPDGPPLGTHGQLWAVMFAHGFIAAALYVFFFVTGFLRSRPQSIVAHWAKVSLLVGLIQIPFYGHLPVRLFIMVGATAIALWPDDALGPRRPK